MADKITWKIDTSIAAMPIFGGVLSVRRNAAGAPIGEWVGEAPAETRDGRLAQLDEQIAAVEAAGNKYLQQLLLEEVQLVKAGPEIISEAGPIEVTLFLHPLGDIISALRAAPGVLLSSLRITHPQFHQSLAGDPRPPAFVGEEPF